VRKFAVLCVLNLNYKDMKKLIKISLVSIVIFCICPSCSVVKTNYSGWPNLEKHNLLYYYLPETILRIDAEITIDNYYNKNNDLVATNTVSRKYTITPEIIADTKNLLILEYSQNNMFSDVLEFRVNNKGLLTNLNATTNDQTASIIADITKALTDLPKGSSKALEAQTYEIIKTKYNKSYTIKAADLLRKDILVEWPLEALNQKDLKKPSQWVPESFTVGTPDKQANNIVDYEEATGSKIKGKSIEGIFTRPIRNLAITIVPQKDTTATATNFIQITDTSKLLIFPIKRVPFTNTVNNLIISDGIITQNNMTRPSPVKGFFEIPINIAKAVVSIPAQIVQIKINTADNNKLLLDKEKALLKAEEEYKTELKKIKAKLDSLAKK
jgi:hypothetical protein